MKLPSLYISVIGLLSTPLVTNAQIPNDFEYLANFSTITILGYNGPGGAINIPSSIQGLPVTCIDSFAFFYLPLPSAVTIPNTVTTINEQAFDSCDNLTNVSIPASVKSIGANAFRGCRDLVSISVDPLNSSYTSVDGTLYDKANTTLIQHPGGRAGASSIPESVTTIADSAFYLCPGLGPVVIPNNVTNIGNWAFDGCEGLTAAAIPSGVAKIGTGAFAACLDLTDIVVDAANPFYLSEDGVLFNKAQTTLLQFPAAKAGSYVIPQGVTNIADNGFDDCKNLSSVVIPNGVSTLGQFAFNSCTGMTNLNLPDGITQIAQSTFAWCSGLQAITIPSHVTSIGESAFSGCANLQSILLPNTLTNLGSEAFSYCSGLTNIFIPSGVRSIGNETFQECSSLTRVTVGSGVTSIDSFAFYDCTQLNSLLFEGNAPSNSSNVFPSARIPTVYYFPGATGWGATFSGAPTVLWNPLIKAVRLHAGQLEFDVTGAENIPILIETSTNLAGVWEPLQSSILLNGLLHFVDTDFPNHPVRFYHLNLP